MLSCFLYKLFSIHIYVLGCFYLRCRDEGPRPCLQALSTTTTNNNNNNNHYIHNDHNYNDNNNTES